MKNESSRPYMMIEISYNFSSPRFNILRVARRCFSLSSVSEELFFSSCNLLVLLLVLSFSRLLSSAFLTSVIQLCLL